MLASITGRVATINHRLIAENFLGCDSFILGGNYGEKEQP